jgi:hypothetical protein
MSHLIELACAALLLSVGCTKEQPEPNPSAQLLGTVKSCNACGNYRVFHDDANNPHCSGSGGNCLPDFILIRGDFLAVNNVIDTLLNKQSSDIKAAFTNNRDILLH